MSAACAVSSAPRRVGEPCAPGAGRPLMVTARLAGAVVLPAGLLALDGLLAAAVAALHDLPPPDVEPVDVEIPVEREPGGRFHLASFSVGAVDARSRGWTQQRPVVAEAQWLGGPRVRRIDVSSGRDKATRKPREETYLVDDRLDWWCVGDPARVRALLDTVSAVGAKRSVGLGRVTRWDVTEVTPWGPGFPVLMDAEPPAPPHVLRPLPVDWPGLPDAFVAQRARLTYPYRAAPGPDAVPCACPEPMA